MARRTGSFETADFEPRHSRDREAPVRSRSKALAFPDGVRPAAERDGGIPGRVDQAERPPQLSVGAGISP